jgi:nifR3 family TIM-barrel protein
MKIGTIQLDNPTVLAPLAGITNLPLRLLAKEAGCGLVCSEMVSAYGLVYGSSKTAQLMDSTPREKPLSVQLFGSDAAIVAEAARMAVAAGADIVDINFGCSVRKILKSGSGAALMGDPGKAEALLTAVRDAIQVPLTIKIRSGWDASGDEAMTLCRMAEACGVDAVAVHPRTARQGFGGCADWSLIGKIKKDITIPVIGNGDILTAQDALDMMAQTGCDAVMVGRGAIGNPLLFTQISDLLESRPLREITCQDRIDTMIRYLKASVLYLGEKKACYVLRSRLGWFVKGLPRAGAFRNAIRHLASESQARELIDDFAKEISADQPDDRRYGTGTAMSPY